MKIGSKSGKGGRVKIVGNCVKGKGENREEKR